MSDLISVIVPVYNSEKYLEKSIQSLLCQTYQNIEVVLVDDGSKDNSLKVCEKIAKSDNRVKVFSKENGGVASARNFGIKNSKGDYIGFMDNDDYVEPDMFETLITELKKTDSYISQIVVEYDEEDGTLTEPTPYQKEYIEFVSAKELKKGIFCQTCSSTCWSRLFKREVLEKYSFLDGRWNEDTLILFKIFSDPKYNKITSVNKVGYHYINRRSSYSRNGFNQGYIDNLTNAEWIIEKENDKELLECAYRLYFHKLIPYYLFATENYLKDNRIEYNRRIKRVRTDFSKWINNKYLYRKEKLILFAIFFIPKLFLKILKKINYKNYFK